jgi:hypothetical protein
MIRLRPLERRLLMVVMAALIPVIVVSFVTAGILAGQQGRSIEGSTIQTMRAMVGAVDTDLALLDGPSSTFVHGARFVKGRRSSAPAAPRAACGAVWHTPAAALCG